MKQWLDSRAAGFDKATVGQLLTLLKLANAESVAAAARDDKGASYESAGTNARQKLGRLEAALGLGRLTQRNGQCATLTELGKRVAEEARLFLEGLQTANPKETRHQTWAIAAGAAWLQSTVVPALVNLVSERPEWRWETLNLRAHEVCKAVRGGKAHFGFVRAGDLIDCDDLTVKERFQAGKYLVVAGEAATAPMGTRALLSWLVEQSRPLVQQGTSWKAISAAVAEKTALRPLCDVLPQIACVTHAEALAAAGSSKSWCIVPATLRRFASHDSRCEVLDISSPENAMCLIVYGRSLGRFAQGEKAVDRLKAHIKGALKGKAT